MSDIAERCGVSAMTVSYVLNRRSGVSEKTREKVIAVVKEMGYTFNPHASRLSKFKGDRKSLTKNIGCVLGEFVNKYSDPYFGEVLEAIEKALIQRGYHVIFVHSWDELKEDTLLRASLLSPDIVDGVIAMGVPFDAFERLQETIGVVVAVDSESPEHLDNITSDHGRGGYLATKHLLELGHQQIVYVGHQLFETGNDRFDGYAAALREAGVAQSQGQVINAALTMPGGLHAVEQLLRNQVPFTALFAHNDALACGIVKGLARHGLRVPQDVSVVGYNDDFIAELVTPELTTVRIDKQGLGRLAAAEIVERVEGGNVPARKQMLGVTLIKRGSSGSAAQAGQTLQAATQAP